VPWDIFEPDRGLKDDYDGTIDSALFIQNEDASWACQIVVKADDGEDPQPYVLSLGPKSGFSSVDGGEVVSGPKPETKINENTAYWKFLKRCMTAGAGEEMRKRSDTLYEGRGPLHAHFWDGLRFHFDVIIDKSARTKDEETGKWGPVKDELTGEVVGRAVSIPTKFLGVGSSLQSASTPSLMDAADRATLISVAKESEDHAAFMQAVLAVKDSNDQPMAKNRAVMSRIADKEWFEELRAG